MVNHGKDVMVNVKEGGVCDNSVSKGSKKRKQHVFRLPEPEDKIDKMTHTRIKKEDQMGY